jgi:hypothetical protein
MIQLNYPKYCQNQDLQDVRINKIAGDKKSSKSQNQTNPDPDNKKSKS